MAVSLDEALQRLDAALGLIEAAVARRLDGERRRGDLETELQIMQDDRARLAMELDGASARLSRIETAAEDVERRVGRAIGTLREVLARAEPDDLRD
jgi:predicted  nucleic acid-binding Zn-ribbon protein